MNQEQDIMKYNVISTSIKYQMIYESKIITMYLAYDTNVRLKSNYYIEKITSHWWRRGVLRKTSN